ncbi:MAG: four helix bundle protein [Patescibacteria group bacterium]|jgi:four helix bundle protein
MKINRFEEIIAWQKARELVLDCYETFNSCRDFSFCDQLKRAVVSIMNNIAEGFERKSNKEFKQFLFISKGSCGEVRSMLDLAISLNYITEEKFDKLSEQSTEISKILSGFIKTL